MGKKYRSPEHQNACQAAKSERKKLLRARAHWAALAAHKLTEMGYPTTASAGYAVIVAKIQLACPEIRGSRTDVFAKFVGEGEKAASLKAAYGKAVALRKAAKRGRAAYKKASSAFFESREWREVRYAALVKHGGRCQCCGISGREATLHVDHVKPRSLYPQLALEISNLQVLCEDCNLGKSNIDQTDWRPEEAHMREISRV